MKHGLQTVTTNKSKTNMGCGASKYQGCVEKYTNSPTQILEVQRLKAGGAQVNNMVRPDFYSN